MRGHGQVDLWNALRISVGRALRSRISLAFSLLWGVGAGIAGAALSPHHARETFIAAVLFAFAISYLSVFPWRVRLLPRRIRRFSAVAVTNGIFAFVFGYVVFLLCLIIPVVLLHGIEVAWMQLRYLARVPLVFGYVFPLVGFGIALGDDATRREQRIQHAGWRLQRLAEEARLVALRAQINPHFFFNALNTIAALIPERPRDAERAVELLAEALRPALSRDPRPIGTLESEVRIARAYADIEQLRFSDRLAFEFDIAPEAAGTQMISLALQPLVENAVRHGASKSAQPHEVRVKAWREGDALHVEVRNGRRGEPAGATSALEPVEVRAGHAIANILARARAIHGPDALVEVRANSQCGVARLVLPSIPDKRLREITSLSHAEETG